VAYLDEDEYSKSLDLSTTAETIVEGHGSLKFEVESRSMLGWSQSQIISLDLKAMRDFDEELDLETIKFTAVETEENEEVLNHINFMMSRSKIENGEVWPYSENVEGVRSRDPDHPAYVGYDLNSTDFEVQNEIRWELPDENVGEDFTLELQAVLDGQISQEIVSTVFIHIKDRDDIETFTEFSVLGEEGIEADYPTDLEVGEYGTISTVVTNHEHEPVDYEIVVGLGEEYEDMEYEGELPSDYNFTFSSNDTYYSTDLSLNHGEGWNQTMNFSIGEPGRYKLSLFLVRDGEIYRDLHLWVDVS
ncbi:MAG: DUF1616 domain-containing protein, partial [Candidatus Saliniplasma sp.]